MPTNPNLKLMTGSRHSLERRFNTALKASNGERTISAFLKTHPEVLFWSFFTIGGHNHYVVPEFALGKSLRCDFVLVQSYSGGYRVEFVELEPVEDCLYNKDRTPSRRLRIAQKQIADWQHYIHDEPASIRYQLAEAVVRKDIFQTDCGNREPVAGAGPDLRDPKSFLHIHFHIVIGRRDTVSQMTHWVRSSHNFFSDTEIVSYDRLLDVARNIDRRFKNPNESIALPSTDV